MIAIVTGANGGIGRSVVSKLLAREFIVFAWVKNKVGEVLLLEYLASVDVRVNNLYIISADFCDLGQISLGFKEMQTIFSSKKIKKSSKVDIWINCAGCFSQVSKKSSQDPNFIVNYSAPLYFLNEFKNFSKENARAVFIMPNFNSNMRHFQISNLSRIKRNYLSAKLMLLNDLSGIAKKGDNINYYFYYAKPTNTNFYIKNVSGVMEYLGVIRKAFSMPPEFAAEQAVLLSTRPEFENESGCVYYNLKPVCLPKIVYSKRFQTKANKLVAGLKVNS